MAGHKGISELRQQRQTAQWDAGHWTAWSELDALRLSAMPALDQISEIDRRTQEAEAQALAADHQRAENRAIADTWNEGKGASYRLRRDNGWARDYQNEKAFRPNGRGDLSRKRQQLEASESFDNGCADTYRVVNDSLQIVEVPA